MFNLEKFDIILESEFIGRNFIYVDELPSTNSELIKNKNLYNKSGTVLLAEKQLQGRGRKNRTWHSSKGENLTFSILLNDENSLKINANHINLLSSLVVANAAENLYQLKAEVKWPNDVLINEKKFAGILTETSVQGKTFNKIVVGFGINVNQTVFQGEFNYPPTSIKFEMHSEVNRENLLAEILNLFENGLINLSNTPAIILDEWRSKCKMIGDKVSIKDGDEIKVGIFYDIDDNGFLVLKRKNEFEKIHFGDVSLV